MFDQYQKTLGVDLWSTHYAVCSALIYVYIYIYVYMLSYLFRPLLNLQDVVPAV